MKKFVLLVAIVSLGVDCFGMQSDTSALDSVQSEKNLRVVQDTLSATNSEQDDKALQAVKKPSSKRKFVKYALCTTALVGVCGFASFFVPFAFKNLDKETGKSVVLESLKKSAVFENTAECTSVANPVNYLTKVWNMVPNPIKKIGYNSIIVFCLNKLGSDFIIGLPYFWFDLSSNSLNQIMFPVHEFLARNVRYWLKLWFKHQQSSYKF